ncbi:MAG: PEP-CTERM sorting domain-containing protein [Thermoguttaceae bacterium]
MNFLSGNITNAALPNVLHPNQRFLTEIQIGTGTDADITQYNIAGNSAIYNIHSDAAQEGGPAETTIMPGAPVGDPLINGVFFIDEAGNTSGNGRPGIDFKSGSNDVPAAAGEGWSDTLNWDANTGVLTWTSDGGPDNADDQEFEVYNGVNGGEHVIAWVIGGYDVPEPSSLILLSIGAITLLAYAWRKRSRTA